MNIIFKNKSVLKGINKIYQDKRDIIVYKDDTTETFSVNDIEMITTNENIS